MNDASSPTLALSACRGVETLACLDGDSAIWAGGSATQRGFEFGAVIIRVTRRDLGETLHPPAAGPQRGSGAAGHLVAEDGAAAAQVLDGPVLGHRRRREGMLGVERVHHAAGHPHVFAVQ